MALIPLRAEHREVQRYRSDREAVLALGTEGKNAEERKAKLAVTLAKDEQYIRLTEDCERLASLIEQREAEIEHLRDLRRDHEWNIRLRLAAALDGRGLPAEAKPDEAFDTVADEFSIGAAVAQARGTALGSLDETFQEKYDPGPPYFIQASRRSAPRNQPVPVADDDDIPFV